MMSRYAYGLLLVLISCVVSAAEQTVALLLYQVTEPGLEPYNSRIIVTPRYMRMDDGVVEGNFVLFDRKSRIIYSVTHSDRTVLEIHPQPLEVESPIKLTMQHEVVESETPLPQVAGKSPQHHRLKVNGSLCYEMVTLAGEMDDALAAMRSFRTVLAGENARILPQVPADMQDPCDLALNTYAPEWQLQFGLPINEWDTQGKGQQLLDFNASYPMNRAMFVLPKGYQHYQPQQLP